MYNKSISIEVIAITILNKDDDLLDPLQCNIIVQIIGGDLICIPYRYACYMTLQYSIIFLCGKSSWMDQLALNGHKNHTNLLACKAF